MGEFRCEQKETKMQEELNRVYKNFLNSAQLSEELKRRLSAPLLIRVSEKWKESKKRVLVVGQETLGWDFDPKQTTGAYSKISSFSDFIKKDNSVESMVRGYFYFDFARHQPKHHRSPFWRAFRQVRAANRDEVDGINSSVLWSNLFRMSLDGGSVVKNGTKEEVAAVQKASKGILRKEVEILKPTSVLFFTGPNYNNALYSEFKNVELLPFKGYPMSRTSYIRHPRLPKSTLRTYHPGYLNRGHWKVVDQVVDAVVSAN